MNRLSVSSIRLASAAVATVWTMTAVGGPAVAASADEVSVVNTETVQVYLDASGKVQSKRVYEQIDLTGHGKVDLRNPVETKGLRNLDGFTGFDLAGHDQIVKTSVDGAKRLRSVSDFDGDLPLKVTVSYRLDGKVVQPGDLVGRSGHLQVQFDVENLTSRQQQVSYSDGHGGTVTKTVDVPIPMVGSLSTTTPSNFTNVTSQQANLAGDGEGGTKLSFTMTLFPPVGSATASFGYEADITDGVVPRVEVSALPVNPLESPTFKSAADSYQGGADTGSQLTSGASQIDANLLRLRDGAADLLAGLVKLNDGADQLSSGLTDTAVPGARKLADGAGQLDDGIGKLDDGADDLAEGTGQVDDGAQKLKMGAGQLATGLGQAKGGAKDLKAGTSQIADGQKSLADGLKQLQGGVSAMPESVKKQLEGSADYQALTAALAAMIKGVGDPSDVTNPVSGEPATLLGGLNALKAGLGRQPGATQATCQDTSKLTPCGVLDALDMVSTKLSGALQGPASADGTVAKLKATIESIAQLTKDNCGAMGPAAATCEAVADNVVKNVADQVALGVVKAQTTSLTELKDAIDGVIDGVETDVIGSGGGIAKLQLALDNESPATCDRTKAGSPLDDCGLKQALQIVQAGVPALVDGITVTVSQQLLASIGTGAKGCDPTKTLVCAADTLAAGSSQLDAGAGTLVGGLNDLAKGGSQLASGAGDLAAGTGRLRDGATQLADGADAAADGSGQLADGAGDLVDGLGDAATGSQQLADGLSKAARGAPQLVDGAERLSTDGTRKLVTAGESTAQSYGEMVAVIDAGAKRAQTEAMAYGAPEGALGLTAYSYVIEGDDGEGDRNLARGLGAVALLGAGAGVLGLRRRFV